MGYTFTKSGNVTAVDGPGVKIKTKARCLLSYDEMSQRISITFGDSDYRTTINIPVSEIDSINSVAPDSDIEILLNQVIRVLPDQDNSAASAAAITPSNEDDIAATRGVYVGGTGTVVAIINGAAVTFTNAAAGSVLPIQTTRINATGTTATGLIALY
jgi:hypothetical protein